MIHRMSGRERRKPVGPGGIIFFFPHTPPNFVKKAAAPPPTLERIERCATVPSPTHAHAEAHAPTPPGRSARHARSATMGKHGTNNKKPFINKKSAVTYALMARPGDNEEGAAPNPGDSAAGSGTRGAGGAGGKGGGGGGEGPVQMWMRTDSNHGARDVMAEASGDDGRAS